MVFSAREWGSRESGTRLASPRRAIIPGKRTPSGFTLSK
jgi:hypothetical protein